MRNNRYVHKILISMIINCNKSFYFDRLILLEFRVISRGKSDCFHLDLTR